MIDPTVPLPRVASVFLALALLFTPKLAALDLVTWVWEEPYPVGAELEGVWGSGPDDVYVAGRSGGLAHFDGTSWSPIEAGVDDNFLDIFGFDSNTLFLVGDDANEIASFRSGVTYTFDGQTLDPQTVEFSGGRPNTAIWGTSANDLVVAVRQTQGAACPQFFDGMTWSPDCTIPLGNQFSVSGIGQSDVYFGQQNQFSRLDRATGQYTGYAVTGTVNDIWVSPANQVFLGTSSNTVIPFDGVVGPELTVPDSNTSGVRGLWGSDEDNIWTVGERIHHFDGAIFTRFERPDGTGNVLNDVWGTGPGDIFAVGEAGTILHFDGIDWVRQAGAQVSAANNSGAGWESMHGTRADNLIAGAGDVYQRVNERWEPLERFDMSGHVRDVWAPSGSSVWAVGDKIWHWDGNSQGDWETTENPQVETLNRIHGVSDADFYVAADDGVLLHYDGAQFSTVTLPNINGVDLNDVWAAAPDRVFVVGDSATILLYDGANWGIHSIPDLGFAEDSITALWGEVVNNVINVYAATALGELLHWPGGSNWDVVDTGLPVTPRNFFGLWGIRTDQSFDLFAVGRAGSFGNALIVRQRNGVFEEVVLDNNPDGLIDVTGSSPGEVYAVDGTRSDILRFDGASWSDDVFPGPDFNVELRGLGVLPDGRVIAGGRDFFLLRDQQWQMMARPLSDIGEFPKLMRTPDGEIYVTGQDGFFSSWDTYHHNGMTFQRLDYRHLDNARRCSSFWSDGTEFFILCARDDNTLLATVHHFDGIGWSTMDFPDQGGHDIWGADADNVFVVGSTSFAGSIAYYDGNPGGTWVSMDPGVTDILRHVHGFAADDVFAGGEDGTLLHYDGTSWQAADHPLPTNTFLNTDIRSLYADPSSGIALAGVSGNRSLIFRNGVWELFDTPKSIAFIKGIWTDGAAIFMATSGAEIIRGDLDLVFESGFESPLMGPEAL